MASACIFCQIVEGTSPSIKLFEDGSTLAFMDIFPWAEGHCLVISKEHAPTIFELSEDSAKAVMATVHRIAPSVVGATGAHGLNLFQANGSAAWQTVDHFHMHLIPRWETDNLQPPAAPQKGIPERLNELGERIRRKIGEAG